MLQDPDSRFQILMCESIKYESSEFMGKYFQAAQLTNERFLTIDHSFFDICQTELPPTPEVRGSSVWQISKNILQE
jgi:hypothetical protein